MSKLHYVSIKDMFGNQFVAAVDAYDSEQALETVADRVRKQQSIECTITHKHNDAEALVMFIGPVTLAVFNSARATHPKAGRVHV